MIEKIVKLTFTEPVLGTTPANQELFLEHVAAKHPDGIADDEVTALPVAEEVEKQSTVFPRMSEGENGETLFFWDYQIKGFFKDAQGMMNRIGGDEKLAAYRKVVDGLIFVYPRRIPILLPEGGQVEWCERPLRISGPQGERVALARSEMIPAGSVIQFRVKLLKDSLGNYLDSWLDYGIDRGLAQWRNSGMGRFVWEDLDAKAGPGAT